MRTMAFCFLIASGLLLAGEPVRPQPPTPERIALLIRRLGDEGYGVRLEATQALQGIGLPAKEQLEAASDSSDPEVNFRARYLLLRLDGFEAQRVFLEAMKGPWQKALKEGRLVGPILGAADRHGPKRIADGKGEGNSDWGAAMKHSWAFLARTQSGDGRWCSRMLGAQLSADVEQTSLALNVFLWAGHTEKVGQYKQTVRRAVAFLMSRQLEDGAIVNENWTEVDNATHAMATWALAEAYSMARIPKTGKAAQRAVEFATKHHDDQTVGFRRTRDVKPDLFTTALFVNALKSARVAGLDVSLTSFESAIRFLDRVEDKKEKTYSYVPGGKPSPHAAVLGVFCRQNLGWKKDDLTESFKIALKGVGAPTVNLETTNVLTNYFATQVAIYQGGDIWKSWDKPFKKAIAKAQIQQGQAYGAWAARGIWGGAGRVPTAALHCMILGTYMRYRPMYK